MRKLSELIVVIRGGGEVGSAIAHLLTRCHFRVCITEIASPLSLRRGVSFSEAVYETTHTIEGVTAERTLISLEGIYKLWRNEKIPILVDPEVTVKALIKPDVLINALMTGRQTNTKMEDAPLVIGIGPGFKVGDEVHLVVDTNGGENLGKVLIEGEIKNTEAIEPGEQLANHVLKSVDSGIFTTERNIGDSVEIGEVVGKLNETPITAPESGLIRGLLRDQAKVLNNTALAEIDHGKNSSVCFNLSKDMRIISSGALESILMSLNVEENSRTL